MFKFDVFFQNIEVINYFLLELTIKSFADMVSYTPQFEHKNNQWAILDYFNTHTFCLYIIFHLNNKFCFHLSLALLFGSVRYH